MIPTHRRTPWSDRMAPRQSFIERNFGAGPWCLLCFFLFGLFCGIGLGISFWQTFHH